MLVLIYHYKCACACILSIFILICSFLFSITNIPTTAKTKTIKFKKNCAFFVVIDVILERKKTKYLFDYKLNNLICIFFHFSCLLFFLHTHILSIFINENELVGLLLGTRTHISMDIQKTKTKNYCKQKHI